MIKRLIILHIILLVSFKVKAQQDLQLSQYLVNAMYINPAYTGYKEETYLQSYFRSQWMGMEGAPTSYGLSIDAALNDGKVGLGFMLANDKIGAQSNLSAYANYSYRIKFGRNEQAKLAFGLAAGIMQLGLDGSKLNPINNGDQIIPTGSESFVIPDANFGIYFNDDKHYLSLSFTNALARISKSKDIIVPVPQPHIFLSGGKLISLSRFNDIKLKPIFLLKDDFKGPTILDLDLFILMNERFSLGGFYRSPLKLYAKDHLQNNLNKQNSFGLITEFFINPSLVIGYSYDQSLNKVSNSNFGSHELSIGIYFQNKKYNQEYINRCYKF
jgi:type IX secretion system PorP/SprF family membrane protein